MTVILRRVNDTYDVVVIGGGIAGTAAALSACAAGARTALISGRPGATALCAGAWSGSMPARLTQLLGEAGYTVVSAPAALPWLDGSFRAFAECEAAHAVEWGSHAVVCGIAGLPAFNASVLSRCWQPHAAGAVSSITIKLPDTPAAGWAPASLAGYIERRADIFCDAVAPHVRRAAASTLVLPAILGLDALAATRAAIESRLGVRVFEVAGGTPSLPGWRLHRALHACAARAGVTVIAGMVVDHTTTGKRVSGVLIAGPAAAPLRVTARSFVLATGKFLGGGIIAGDTFRESVFDLPVWVEHVGERFERVEPLALTNPERAARQPILSSGVAVDQVGCPVDAFDAVVFENVIVAGAVRAGIDGSAMNLGDMAAEGWAAGEKAAA